MLLSDLHIHSIFSDGKLTVPEIVDFYGSRGFGVIAITDHLCEEETIIGKSAHYLGLSLTPAKFPIYLEILKSEAERAMDQYGMLLIPGFELSKNSISNHRSAHILGLGISSYVQADGDVLELARKIRAQGALAIAAHPVHTRKREKQTYHLWDRRMELETEFDAWEVASGPFLFEEVASSKLPKIATSDLHRPEQALAQVFHGYYNKSWFNALVGKRQSFGILGFIPSPAPFEKALGRKSVDFLGINYPLSIRKCNTVV